MTAAEHILNGRLYDGVSPTVHEATLYINGSRVVLNYGEVEKTYKSETLLVSPRSGNADRFILLPDGCQYHGKEHAILDQLPQEFVAEGIVAWLENRLSVAILSIVVVIGSLLIGYFYGLPAVAERMIDKIPIATETRLGNHLLQLLDDENVFSSSKVSVQLQASITDEFMQLHQDLQISEQLQLHFRDAQGIGPNAFAFPGGVIVITDQLIEMAQSNNEILAILAHEAGHIEYRHSMRNILQSSIVALTVTTITADAGSLGTVISGLPVILLQTTYSRDFEREADDFALRVFNQNNIPITAFADILERLEKQYGDGLSSDFSFFSTHPISEERIKNILENEDITTRRR